MSLALHEALSKHEYRNVRELARLMGCTARDVRHFVEQARKNARLPIMSGPDGYRLAQSVEEYALNVERRHKRALVQLVTVQGEKAYLEKWRNHVTPPPVKPSQEALPW